MKEFNLEEAKAGKPVCTRDGRKARIVCFDRKEEHGYNLIALIDGDNREQCQSFMEDGRYAELDTCDLDLFMYSEKKEGWVNIYRSGEYENAGNLYATKEDALSARREDCVATTKIEWEE